MVYNDYNEEFWFNICSIKKNTLLLQKFTTMNNQSKTNPWILLVIVAVCVPLGYGITTLFKGHDGEKIRQSEDAVQMQAPTVQTEPAEAASYEYTPSPMPEESAPSDDYTPQVTHSQQASASTPQRVQVEPQPERVQNEPQTEPVQRQSSTHAIGNYAEWTGAMKGGKPHGMGTMRFKAAHAIDGQRMAQAGDYITDAEYSNGELVYGTWHHKDGSVEEQIDN